MKPGVRQPMGLEEIFFNVYKFDDDFVDFEDRRMLDDFVDVKSLWLWFCRLLLNIPFFLFCF